MFKYFLLFIILTCQVTFASPKISKMVSKVINREMTKNSAKKVKKPNIVVSHPKKKINNQSEVKNNRKKILQALKKSIIQKKSLFEFDDKEIAEVKITTVNAKIGYNITNNVHNFEFFPAYSNNYHFYDNEKGVLSFHEKINGKMSILRGTISKKRKVDTKIDLVLDNDLGPLELVVPLIDEDQYNEFLDKHKVVGHGGHVLVEIDEVIDTVAIDSQYDAKFYLDYNFKVVKKTNDYSYVLFAGVDTGNTLISFETLDGEYGEKVIFVSDKQIYFEANAFYDSSLKQVALYQKNILSNRSIELNLDVDDLFYFNSNKKTKRVGTNLYQYQVPMLPTGFRQYLDIRHLDMDLYVGHWNSTSVEVPNNQFIEYVYKIHDIDTLDKRCMIQINLPAKRLHSFEVEGEGDKGPIYLERTFLERDGNFYYDESVDTTKVFLMGDSQGIISSKVAYLDGTVDYLQTYCIENAYLAEQL
ncbi:MAG: hypothetical protein ISR65_04270 [Bacteriovoracaceae bacterium]|nr:hypothetical protein [Bacteriovoracaceae bacterium]